MYRVQVDLAAIVDLLSRHLYAEPEVYVRELLQNAADAIQGRRLVEPEHEGTVTVEVTPGSPPTLVVEDNGVGLDEGQIHEFLATVGRSTKRDELELARGDFLGQFGIGLLSCFLVADEVVVVTRAVGSDTTYQWTGRANGTYEVTPLATSREPGSTVYVRPRAGDEHRVTGERVARLVEQYAALLDQPVHVRAGGVHRRIGGDPLPWAGLVAGPVPEQRREDLLAWAEHRFGQRFLDVVPLDVPVSETTGVAFIHAEARSPGARHHHLVTLKGMLLTESADGLLPDWAFFARSAVDTRGLRPTASREALVDDDLLAETRTAIGRQLRAWLLRTAEQTPARLRSFVALHQTSLKAIAVHDQQLLAAIADWLPVETSQGSLTLGELARRSEPIRYTSSLDTFRQLMQVSAAQGLCLVNGGYTYDSELLRSLPDVLPGTDVVEIASEDVVSALAEVDSALQQPAMALASAGSRALRALGAEVTVRSFRPRSVPALLVVDPDSRYRRSISRGRGEAGAFWGEVLEGVESLWEEKPTELCLNAANDVVLALLAAPDSPRSAAGLELLYVQALLLGHHPLDAKELRLMSSSVLQLLDGGASA